MNLLTREVARGARKIELQPIEFSLLEYLMRNAGQVVSKTMIMEHVWNYNFDPQTNTLYIPTGPNMDDPLPPSFNTSLSFVKGRRGFSEIGIAHRTLTRARGGDAWPTRPRSTCWY